MAGSNPIKWVAAGVGVLGGVAALAGSGAVALRHNMKKINRPFYADAERRMVIPGLKDGFVPQDLFYVESEDVWLFSGYCTGHRSKKASPIYVVDTNGSATKVLVKLPSGIVYSGHGAAVCATDKFVFLTVKDGYVVMDLAAVMGAKDGDEVDAFAHVPVELEPAFMNIQNDVLYIGEFYHNIFYNTPRSHWCTCPSGETNPALMYAYDASDDPASFFGFSARPSRVYSIPGNVQGMCVAEDGRIVLSKSWGFRDAQVAVYKSHTAMDGKRNASSSDIETDASALPTYLVAGEEAPLYYLDRGNLERILTVPPMAEGIDSHDGEVWLANESASNLYLFGKLTNGKYVYSFPVE